MKINSRILFGPVNSNFHFEYCQRIYMKKSPEEQDFDWVFVTVANTVFHA